MSRTAEAGDAVRLVAIDRPYDGWVNLGSRVWRRLFC